MRIYMERKVNLGNFENITLGVELTDSDMPGDSAEPVAQRLIQLQLQAYREILAFSVYHKAMKGEDALAELERFKKVQLKRPSNGHAVEIKPNLETPNG